MFKKAVLENWENPHIIQKNKLPARTPILSHPEVFTHFPKDTPTRISLSGEWKFCYTAAGPQDRPKDFYKPDVSVEEWDTIQVPGVWELQGYGTPYYLAFSYPPAIGTAKRRIPHIDQKKNPVGSYRKELNIPSCWLKERIILHLDGVKAACSIWLNGRYLGYSQGSMNPAEFDITHLSLPGANTLAIEVYTYCDGTYLEDQDMWFLHGIFRDIWVHAEPGTRLDDFFIKPTLDSTSNQAQLAIEAVIAIDDTLLNQELRLELRLGSPTLYTPMDTTIIPDAEPIVLETIIAKENIVNCKFHLPIENPALWNAEEPWLYPYALMLSHADGTIIDLRINRLGIRSIEIAEARFLVNGKPILFKGVNRHDFSPYTGWAVSEELRETDLRIMKQHNINAIRTSHYPNPTHLYELADLWGFYIIDEADVETHGVRRKQVPGDSPLWTPHVVDRCVRMVKRDRNHPSIVMWSLGNEAGDGSAFTAMKKAVLALDDSRPIHYEGDTTLEVSDVMSMMYPTPADEEAYGRNEDITFSFIENILNKLAADNKSFRGEQYADKPVMTCEFAHSMGNSLGNFAEHMEVFEKYPSWCGGFIWDFVDQALYKGEVNGKPFWAYGGDFNEDKTHYAFCANGIIGADRSLHPAIQEVKKVFQPVHIRLLELQQTVSALEAKLSLRNRNNFSTFTAYTGHWILLQEGKPISEGTFPLPETEPGKEANLSLTMPFSTLEFPASEEYILTISIRNATALPWSEPDYEIAWEQFPLELFPLRTTEAAASGGSSGQKEQAGVQENSRLKPEITRNGSEVTYRLGTTSFTTHSKTGALTSLCFNGIEQLATPWGIQLFRAPTDNDRNLANFKPRLDWLFVEYFWKRAEKRLKVRNIIEEITSSGVSLRYSCSCPHMKKPLILTYTLQLDNSLEVAITAVPKRPLNRLGFQGTLAGAFSNIVWYGKGPQENYCDRNTGAKTAIHALPLQEIPHNYMRPQENGNRTQVRWFTLTSGTASDDGLTITATGNRLLEIGAWPYTREELEEAQHVHELPEHDTWTVRIDWGQKGVGGDKPGMLSLLPEYTLPAKRPYSYSFKLSAGKRS